MKKLLALVLAIGSLVCSAQNNLPTGTQTSPNLVYTTKNPWAGPAGTEPYTWTGFITTDTGGGGLSGGEIPGYNPTLGQFMFGYQQGTVAYRYALSQALKNSGMSWLGYNYSWEYFNQDYSRGSLSATVDFAANNGTSLHSKSWVLGPTTEGWAKVRGTEVFNNALATANISSFGLSFTGQDDRWWAGHWGPQVRSPNISVLYTFDQCSTNPLSSPSCAGYAEAYKTQQCTANPLYDPSCPGYTVAYKTQQCAANPLYAVDCPGYAEAYFNQQCLLDSLYDRKCEGYATAYAIKYIVPLDPAVTKAVNQQLTTVQETYKNDPARVTVVNSTVDSVLTTPSTTSATSTSPASVMSVINQPSATVTNTLATAAAPPPPPAAKQEEKAQDQKKTDTEVRQVERKSGGNAQDAKKEVAQRAKDLAQNANRATTLDGQVATQGLLVGLIGYVPGFAGYQQATVPDTNAMELAAKYSKPAIDNQNAQRRLQGANDRLHREMVDGQYKN